MSYKNVPIDKKLYEKVKTQIKKRVKIWPSAYASGQLVTEYKRQGGKYKKVKVKKKSSDLDRWFKEDWRNVCEKNKKGDYKKCGRKKATLKAKDYPYCRPKNRITSKTPKTISELSKKNIKKMCDKKKKSMKKSKGKQTRVRLSKNKKGGRKRSKRKTSKRKRSKRKRSKRKRSKRKRS
jgi:hypothetical protein